MMVSSNQLILAGVESIRDRHYAYSSCDRCYSKVLFDGDTANWICIKCRSNRPNVVRRYRMNFRITDNTHLANVTVFGHNLDKFFGCTADEFYENLSSLSQICPQITENLVDSVIEDTFVGCSFLFGFKMPHAKHRDSTCNGGDFRSLDMIRPNQDAISFPGGLQNSEKTFSNTVAWQMLFAYSEQRFMTVVARLRQIVDDFGSSQSLNTVVNETLLFTGSGYETVPSPSHMSPGKRKRVSSIDCTEQSLVLSCDQDAGSNVEPKQLPERASVHSSAQFLSHLPENLAENSFTNTMTDKLILNNIPDAHCESHFPGMNTQFNNVQLLQHGRVCDVSKRNYKGRFCSDVLAEKDEAVPTKLNEVPRKKLNNVSNSHLNEPGHLSREPDQKNPEVNFDESSVDEIEICRAASVISQDCHVFADNFSFKRCSASAVSQEIEKKGVSLSSPSSQLGICATTSAQLQSCTLDLVEAPYSEDLEAFLKDCEENERLTCELHPVPASNSKQVVCHLESVSQDSLSENKNNLDWEQPYSEDLEEFLKGHKADDKPSQVHLKPLNSSSMLQQTSVRDSFTSGTIVLNPIEPACPHVSSLQSLTESGCSDELFSFWSDDFEHQVAHSSLSKSVEKQARHCSSQRLLAKSLKKLSKNLRRNSLQQSPGRSPAKHFGITKMEELCSVVSVNETKENVEPQCYASDTFDSSLSVLSGHNRHCPQRIRKSTRKTTSNSVTPPVIGTKKTPRLKSFLNYKTPVNAISSSSGLRANACDSFSSKSLHKKATENCVSRKSLIAFRPSTKKVGNETFATPVGHSFDLFQSPCFTCAGSSHRQSRLQADFPSSLKFRFSSTPLSTVGVCRLSSATHKSQQLPRIVADFPHGPADIAANTCLLLAEPSSPDFIASTLVPVSPCACVLNSYRDRTSSLACETAASRSASLISSISPELFGNSLQRYSCELSPGQAVCSRIGGDRKEIPVTCNLFNSSQNVNRPSNRNNISGLPFNQSEDLFGDSGDLFLD